MTTTGRGVAYEPKILRSLVEICEIFGVGSWQVKQWVRQGAPIVVDGEKNRTRYTTEVMRLQLWRERQLHNREEDTRKASHSSPPDGQGIPGSSQT